MGLKAGWLALFIFVWIVGIFLGSTYDYQNTEATVGTTYSTGTATFTTGSATVTGAGTTWVAAMEDGVIIATADGIPTKILTVVGNVQITLYSPYSGAGGVGLAYTIVPTAGWAGTATGGYTTAPNSTLQTLMESFNAIQRNPVVGTFSVVVNGEFWAAAFKIVTWQWSFLYNADGSMAYGLFYWIFLFPFVAMGMLSLLLLAYGIITGNVTF